MSRMQMLSVCVLTLLVSVFPVTGSAQDGAIRWQAWDAKTLSQLSADNSGAHFVFNADLKTPSGADALEVTPGGTADETKLAFPVSDGGLQGWTAGQVEVEVYLPPENDLNPNSFFLGMANTTGAWRWIGGVFGDVQDDHGWTRILFSLEPAMTQPNPDREYVVYLSGFYTDEDGSKVPLTEPFDLGSIYLTNAPAAAAAQDAAYQAEVDHLLTLDDDAFLDAVARATFDYFWREANPDTGLIRDRSTANSAASIAAVGFGLSAIPLAVERGWISAEAGYQRVLTTLRTFADGDVQGEHGFFYHFVDMRTGARVWDSELSSIDTALLMAGVLTAGDYFAGTEVEPLAQQLYENVDWQWMATKDGRVKMGWTPDGSFIPAAWDHFDESMILYALAIGSPTHPVSPEAWDLWRRPVNAGGGIDDAYLYLPGEPLFVYQYPLVWLDLRNRQDAYANYFNNTVKACERNRQFALDHAADYATYRDGVWGISASDGPDGYRAYGAALNNHDGTIAPYASAACLPFTPDAAVESMRALLRKYGSQVWREYGFVSAINADQDWYSTEHIGIDEGDLLLMIANSQDGFVWNRFMQNPNIQHALDAMGFVESAGDFAVTPDYLAQAAGS